MDIVSREAAAYLRAADMAGVELPAAVTEARANLERIEAELAALPQPEKVPASATLVSHGAALADAEAEHARLKNEARARTETRKVAEQARRLARRSLSRLVGEHRDQLIHSLRPVVDGLIEQARPLAQTLASFAPRHDAAAIARKASAKQINAWREAEEAERQFGACLAAWRASFKADTARQGGWASPTCPRDFHAGSMSEAHRYWQQPELVTAPRLNGSYYGNPHATRPSPIHPTVLTVAAETSKARFRLATVAELRELYNQGVR